MARLSRHCLPVMIAAALLAPLATADAHASSLQPPADTLDRWATYIAEASARFGIPEPWIRRVMRAESGGRTQLRGRPIVSHAGAMGLMQLMPGTWRAMRAAHGLGADPHAPRDNILAGTAYLRAMYDRFGYPGLFGAYNAGPQRYAEHLQRGRRLPSETIAYMAAVTGARASTAPRAAPGPIVSPPALFAALPSFQREAMEGSPASHPVPSQSLFVPLRSVVAPGGTAPGPPQ